MPHDSSADPSASSPPSSPHGTPFARVLTAYMWSKTPPWSGGKLAAVLGLNRIRVAKWVSSSTTPELETMLAVMAHLGIPLRALLNAYAEMGVPIPQIEPDDEEQRRLEQERINALGAATAVSSLPIPPARQGRGGGVGRAAGAYQPPQLPQTPPLSDEERERLAQEQADRDWQTMLEHTRMTLRMTGMGDVAIDAMLKTLDDDRERHKGGQPSERQRRIAEEMRPQTQESFEPAGSDDDQRERLRQR